MIYTDGVHLVGDSLEELHKFARGMGLKREWFQDHPQHPHYDLTTVFALKRALSKGAELVNYRKIIEVVRRVNA